MAIRIKNGQILLKNGKIAFGADGSPCGCCGGGACSIHGVSNPIHWEILAASNPGPGGESSQGAFAVSPQWVAFGESASPLGGVLATGLSVDCPDWETLFVAPDPVLALKRWVPLWDTRAYTLSEVSLSGTTLTTKISIDKWHTFSGLPYSPTSVAVAYQSEAPAPATPWAGFFFASGARPYGLHEGDNAFVDYDELGDPGEYIEVTGGSAFYVSISSPATDSAPIMTARHGTPGAAGSDLSLRMRLGGSPSPVIELVSFSAITDAAGAPVIGGTIEAPGFPVSLANSNANFEHSYSVLCTVKDSGGVVVATFTAAGSFRRGAWGATARTPVVDSASIHTIPLPPSEIGTGGKSPLQNVDIVPMPTYPWKSQYSLTIFWEQEIDAEVIGPIEEVPGTFRTTTQKWWPAVGTHSVTFSALTASSDLFPNLLVSGLAVGSSICPGSFFEPASFACRPNYGELEVATVRQGTGIAVEPVNFNTSGSWTITMTNTADLDLTSKYVGYDSVILPAGTPLQVKVTGYLKPSWKGGTSSLIAAVSLVQSVTLDTLIGGVPGTISESVIPLGGTSNPAVVMPEATPSFTLRLFASAWGAYSANFAAGAAALSVYSPPNQTGAMNVNIINSTYYSNGEEGVTYCFISLTSPTIGGRGGNLRASDIGEHKTRPMLHRGATSLAIPVFLAPGNETESQNYINETGQRWVADAAQTLSLKHDTDLTKTYGEVRLSNGCVIPAQINGEAESFSIRDTGDAPFSSDTVKFEHKRIALNGYYYFYDNLSAILPGTADAEAPPVDLQATHSSPKRAMSADPDVAISGNMVISISIDPPPSYPP